MFLPELKDQHHENDEGATGIPLWGFPLWHRAVTVGLVGETLAGNSILHPFLTIPRKTTSNYKKHKHRKRSHCCDFTKY